MATASKASTRSSITTELLDWMLVPLLLLAPVLVLFGYLSARDIAKEVYEKELTQKVRALAEQIVVDPSDGQVRALLSLTALIVDEDVTAHAYRLDGSQGFLQGDDDLPSVDARITEAALNRPLFRDTRLHGEKARVVAITVSPRDRRERFTLQLAETMDREERLAQRMLARLVPQQLLVLLLATLLAYVGLRRGLRPLVRLSDEIRSRKAGDLRPVELSVTPAEVEPLVRELNGLIEQAQQESERRRQFSDNAAHQLRTPLAGISLTAELALRSRERAEVDAGLSTIVKTTQRAIASVNQLLLMARVEHPETLLRENVDLRSLLTQILNDAIPMAIARRIDLGLDDQTIPKDLGDSAPLIEVRGDRLLLGELFANLVNNALRHTPDAGSITVTLRFVPPGAKSEMNGGDTVHYVDVHVEDSGSGVAPENRERVFERFYRAAPTTNDGSGLGLPIAREVARAHQGEIRFAEPDVHPGAHVVVRLPLNDAASATGGLEPLP